MGNVIRRRRLGADIVSVGMQQVGQRFTVGGMPAVSMLFAAQTKSSTTIALAFTNPPPLAAVASEFSVGIDAGSETPTDAVLVKNVITLTILSTMTDISVVSVSHTEGSGIVAFTDKAVANKL